MMVGVSTIMNKDVIDYTSLRNDTLSAKMTTDKKFAVLKMGYTLISTGGLGWYILYTLCGIRFAVENNFIPVVDWRNCKIPQYDASKVGKENVWEYYFEQPFNVSIEEAYNSNDFFVIDDVSELASVNILDLEKFIDFFDDDTMTWRRYFQQYIRIKAEVKKYFECCRNKQGVCDDDIIGVLARGTDYKELRPVGHLCPISMNEIFNKIDEFSEKMAERKIFLATEDKGILREFENKYSGKVCSVETRRYEKLGQGTLNVIYKYEDGYDRDLKYLYSLYVISKCSIGIYSACGGGAIASLLREKPGISYNFLCKGHNRAKGIIVGSYIEKKQAKMISMGNKPIMFYALNTLKLIHVKEIDIIISDELEKEYQALIGSGSEFGMKINYVISDTYNVVEYMKKNQGFMSSSKLVLLYTDCFIHGKGVIKELSEKVNAFDGAYVWGTNNYYSDHSESIRINKKNGVPEEAYNSFMEKSYSLLGRYVFDFELNDIIQKINGTELKDILNEYIRRRKLFFLECKRGIVYSKIEDEGTLKKVDQMIQLMEEVQRDKIGDFASFRGECVG